MQSETFSVGVVISTYNNPEWLEKTLWGYLFQTRPADEIVIAEADISKLNVPTGFRSGMYGMRTTVSRSRGYSTRRSSPRRPTT